MKLYYFTQAFFFAITTTKTAVASSGDGRLEWDEYAEFGRTANHRLKTISFEPSDADLLYRELIEANYIEMASMSMSMSLDNNAVSAKTAPPSEMPTDIPATSTPAPTAALTEETNSSLLQEGCNDEPQAAIAIPLEVDTAADKSSFEAELVDAIATGLSDDYIICGSRRLEDGNFGISNLRVGNITVVKHPTDTCVPKAATADACHIAYAQLVVWDGLDGEISALRNSLMFIFANDITFTDDLPSVGVMEVRLKEGAGESEANMTPTTLGSTSQPTRSAVVAILSAAGVSVIAALAFRGLKRKSDAEKYIGTDSESDSDTLPIAASNSAI